MCRTYRRGIANLTIRAFAHRAFAHRAFAHRAFAHRAFAHRAFAHRPRSSARRVAAGIALVLVLSACGRASETHASVPTARGATYTLMQMNLCLSGLGGCYDYPAVLHEAEGRIFQEHPQAVTFNEACRGDVAQIARRVGYHLRFDTVIYGGRPLPCIRPRGRGIFGDAVLTKAAIESSQSRPFLAQAGIEQRRWLCVTTRARVEVCTAHLASNETDEVAANDPQCTELRALLVRRAAIQRTIIFAGDLNRPSSCAPRGFWARSDASAQQDPGLQQAYGAGALRSPSADVIPARHTDHDILLVRASLTGRR